MKNRMEKKREDEMEAGLLHGFTCFWVYSLIDWYWAPGKTSLRAP